MTITNGTVKKIGLIVSGSETATADPGSFSKLKDNDQQAYWGWRHDHSDEQLKIVIH